MEVPKIEAAGNSQYRVFSMLAAACSSPADRARERSAAFEPGGTPSPASPLAVPSETARAQINMATVMNDVVWPRFGDTVSIGSVAVKPPIAVKAISGATNWGFSFL